MINMMKDLLQYVPQTIFLAVIFLILLAGVAFTVKYFLKAGKNSPKR